MIWDSEELWKKAKLYIMRGYTEDRDSALFAFWLIMGLELLGRSAISKVHPSLLADPREGDNLLYACGVQNISEPKSVPAKTVFDRCAKVVEGFTNSEFKICMFLMEKRNSEVHTAELAFENLPTKLWFPDFLRVCDILLKFLGKTLDDLLDPSGVKEAKQLISMLKNKREEEVRGLIKKAKLEFNKLAVKDRLIKIQSAEAHIKRISDYKLKVVQCPSCESQAIITGEILQELEPLAQAEYIEQKVLILPTKFECFSCGLKFDKHEYIYASGFGDRYSVTLVLDPKDYYRFEFTSPDERWADFEPDYGND